MFKRIIATTPTWVTVPLRLTLGIIFIAHGAQLVFGAWSGPGLKGMMSFPAPFAFMRPAWLWMAAAAVSHLVGMSLALLIAGGGQASADNAIAGGRGYRR